MAPRLLNRLTDAKVRAAPPTRARLADGGGLYLDISTGGTKSWVYVWKRNGAKREMGLGSFPAVGLAKARQKAQAAREAVADGKDPIADRQKDAAIPTFAEAVERYIGSIESEWRNAKHRYQWEQTLGDSYCKNIRQKLVSEVTDDDVFAVLEPIWRTKQETASRLRGRLERVFDFAKVNKWRTGDNPAKWRGNLKERLSKRQKLQRGHMPAMHWRDVPAFVQRVRAAEAMAARALELAILTACRSNEVLGAKWDEVDFAAKTWTIPPERTKTAEQHVVPLSTRAVELLETLYETRTSDFIFPSVNDRGNGTPPFRVKGTPVRACEGHAG